MAMAPGPDGDALLQKLRLDRFVDWLKNGHIGADAFKEAVSIKRGREAQRSFRERRAGSKWSVPAKMLQNVARMKGLTLGLVEKEAAGTSAEDEVMAVVAADVNALVDAMEKHAGETTVQEPSIRALMCLAAGAEDVQRKVAEPWVIDAVVQAMKNHPHHAGVQEMACAFFCNLAVTRTLRERVVAAGGRVLAAAAIERHPRNEYVQTEGKALLDYLRDSTRDLASTQAANNPIDEGISAVKQAEQAGDVAALLSAMRQYAEHGAVVERACGVLCNLAAGNEANQARIIEAGGAEAVVAVLLLHATDRDVQAVETACMALINLSMDEANQERVVNAGGIESLIVAMRRHEESAGLQERGCSLLGILSAHADAYIRRIAEARGVDSVVAAMRRHKDAGGVQSRGCLALYNLAILEKERILRSGARELALTAQRRHRGDPQVLQEAGDLLGALGGA